MRITTPSNVSLQNEHKHPLVFTGSKGEQFKISILEHDLVRIQHLPDGKSRMERTWMVTGFYRQENLQPNDVPLEGRQRNDLSPFSLTPFNLIKSDEYLQIQTDLLTLKINTDDFSLRWKDTKGRLFAADLTGRAYSYDHFTKNIYHYLERRQDEHYYGFGERAGPLDKYGMRMRMMNLDALGYNAETGDPLYKHFPFYITFIPKLQIAYGLFYDNLATTIFDMGKEVDNYYPAYRYYMAEGGDLDYYLIYGPSIQEVVQKFSALTGRISLPPRWSLGYLGSTMTYTEAQGAQELLQRFVDLCRQHKIPCDLFHLSSGFGSSDEGKRYVFNWNLKKIPDPKGLVDYFHQSGIRLAANIKPSLLTSHPRYQEVAQIGAFIQSADQDKPELCTFWGGKGAHLDFTNPVGYNWWKQRVLDRLLDFGIDSTWNDNNEYPIWDDDARCNGFGDPIPLGLIRPLHPLLMTRASKEAQETFHPDQRPFLLSRSGCPGIQRYAQTWSGDNRTSWHSLRYNIPMGLGLSLSGAPNTGHDVGGFAGRKPEPELFVRWVQNGIFHPRFTIHSWNEDNTVNEPWMYPEVLPIIRSTIEFRYRLIPYLYSIFFEAARNGNPIIRPLVYHFPKDEHCFTESFDFMLGPNLLVISVFEDGARSRQVYLPEGQQWCNFHTGEWYLGGNTYEIEAPLEHLPLLVPAGGIVPFGKVMQYINALPDDQRQVYLFPHSGKGYGSFKLIEDDGVSNDYLIEGFTELNIEVLSTSEIISIQVTLLKNGYNLPYKEIEFILPPNEERSIQLENVGDQWKDSQNRKHFRFPMCKIINT